MATAKKKRRKSRRVKFSFPHAVEDEFPLGLIEGESFRLKKIMPVVEWLEKHYILTKNYVNPGAFRAYRWQVEPLNALNDWDVIYYLGPVQTGKSVMGEACVHYSIDNYSLSGMCIYANEKTVKKVFKYRFRPAIEHIPVLRKYWSGKEDDLTISNIELTNCLWGIASAENKNDIASFPAGFVYMSEVAKYRAKDFDPISMGRGRQGAYSSSRFKKQLLESSPYNVGDAFYNEIYRSGVLVLEPHVQCPHCMTWQVLTDSQIKALNDEAHDPARLRRLKEKSVVYQCVKCSTTITEQERVKALEKVVWAARDIQEGDEKRGFKQSAEVILESGEVLDADDRVNKYEAVCYNWNRLVDVYYKFYECLARFFESRRNPQKFRVYQNEDMARFFRTKKDQVDENTLLSKIQGYVQSGPGMYIPDKVLVITIGMDSQDTGFYLVARGFGANMETWLLRQDFFECSVKEDIYKLPQNVAAFVKSQIQAYCFFERPDGVQVAPKFGFIDRGGHRSKDVDAICKEIPFLHPYIGSTFVNLKKGMVEKSATGNHYMGQTELFSDMVADYMESDLWHLPEDIGDEYLKQVVQQYTITVRDKYDQPKIKHISGTNDHYRDCENLNFAAAHILELERHLATPEGCQKIENLNKGVHHKTEKSSEPKKDRPTRRTTGWSNNFSRKWSV